MTNCLYHKLPAVTCMGNPSRTPLERRGVCTAPALALPPARRQAAPAVPQPCPAASGREGSRSPCPVLGQQEPKALAAPAAGRALTRRWGEVCQRRSEEPAAAPIFLPRGAQGRSQLQH